MLEGDTIQDFLPLRHRILEHLHQCFNRGMPLDYTLSGTLPSLYMYYRQLSHVPQISTQQLQDIFGPLYPALAEEQDVDAAPNVPLHSPQSTIPPQPQSKSVHGDGRVPPPWLLPDTLLGHDEDLGHERASSN